MSFLVACGLARPAQMVSQAIFAGRIGRKRRWRTSPGMRNTTQMSLGDLGVCREDAPINRLVDAVVPDGEAPRAFIAMVAAFVADHSHDATYHQLRADLQLWKHSHERLAGADTDSALLTEILPVSKALSDVADVGLTCIGALYASLPMTREEREAHMAVLDSANQPLAEVTLAVIPGICALLDAVPDDVGTARSE